MVETVVRNTVHIVIALGLPPLLLGVIAKTKALVRRPGPGRRCCSRIMT